MTEILSVWFLYWIIYSLLGWVVETIYCSVIDGHFVERGFLNGPMCPIYGFGSIYVLLVVTPYVNNTIAVFVIGMISTSVLEYITSFVMEKLFKMRWWDYSDYKFNIKGRICLKNSLMFGILCVALIQFIHPPIEDLIYRIPLIVKYLSTVGIFVVVIADVVTSVCSVVNLNHKLEEIHQLKEQILEKFYQENMARKLENLRENRDSFIDNKLSYLKELKESLNELKEIMSIDKVEFSLHEKLRVLQTETKYVERRLLRAFPKLKSEKYNDALHELKKNIKEFKAEHSKKRIN